MLAVDNVITLSAQIHIFYVTLSDMMTHNQSVVMLHTWISVTKLLGGYSSSKTVAHLFT